MTIDNQPSPLLPQQGGEQTEASMYRFLRDETNWCDDHNAWLRLGELSGQEFDNFILEKMENKNG